MADSHRPEYYECSDIDWFCTINGINIHVASMGRDLPQCIEKTLPLVYKQVSEIEMAPWQKGEGFWLNTDVVRRWCQLGDPYDIARYLSSFVVMARKGFFSFAPVTPDITDNDYYLMAKPTEVVNHQIEGLVSFEIPDLKLNYLESTTAVRIVDLINQTRKRD